METPAALYSYPATYTSSPRHDRVCSRIERPITQGNRSAVFPVFSHSDILDIFFKTATYTSPPATTTSLHAPAASPGPKGVAVLFSSRKQNQYPSACFLLILLYKHHFRKQKYSTQKKHHWLIGWRLHSSSK